MPITAPPPNTPPSHARPHRPTTPTARALMDRMQRLADRRVAEVQCPIAVEPAPKGPASRPAMRRPAPSKPDAETPEQRDLALASKLATILDDPASLGYYEHLARRSREGRFLPRRTHLERRDLLLTKARQIASRKAPHGPIRNPAACFVGWVKGLG